MIESRIQEAMAAGAFENLAGAGRPLPARPEERLAGDNWLGFKVLQNGGLLPAWLDLAREIEALGAEVEALDARHARWVETAAASGDWEGHAGVLRSLRATFEERARALRAKQDRYNHDAPSVALERPGIWVEHRLARLDERLREAGCPGEA